MKDNFQGLFEKADKGLSKLWLQDGDPSQNATSVKRALKKLKAELFAIPARSPDLNPIENLFHLVRRKLHEQALDKNITRESFEQFKERVINTFLSFPSDVIDRIIESMRRRINLITTNKGNRIKY